MYKDKIIVALDVDNLDSALKLAKDLKPYVGVFKVGLELINSVGTPQIINACKDYNIFFDAKFMDIPNTVASASRVLAKQGVWMFNLHALGGKDMMAKALEAAHQNKSDKRPLVIAVTILTSMNAAVLKEVGVAEKDVEAQVIRLARLAKDAGLDGVVASPHEIRPIKEACGTDFKVITPGVRSSWAKVNDQKRIMTPKEAIDSGADYIVIGRPITRPPEEIGSPTQAVKKILQEMEN